jgi:hypothetical protein
MGGRQDTVSTADMAETLALGYLRYLRAPRRSAAEEGPARAHKGLDDVAPRGRVSPGPQRPFNGGEHDET